MSPQTKIYSASRATGSASASHTPAAGPRHHGLDWLRAVAALSVIALHAGIAYTIRPFPGLVWAVQDPRPSPAVDALTWWIDTWIMPVFFMMGGFLAAQLHQHLSAKEFLKHRARRLLYPLAFAGVVILPMCLYVWLTGWLIEGRIPPGKLRSLHLQETGRGLWGVGHLWFLEYLFVFCVGAWLLYRLIDRIARHATSARSLFSALPTIRHTFILAFLRSFPLSVVRSPLSLLLLAACSTLALWWEPQIVIGFRNAWHPLPANLLYYAPCFAAGWWMMYRRSDDRRSVRLALAGLLTAVLLFSLALPLIHAHAAAALVGPSRLAMVALFTACGWLTALAALRLGLVPCPLPPTSVRYLSQASFWMYLFHHPMVGLAQVALHGSSLPAGAKFAIVWISAVSLCLLTYEVCVRRTWVGVLLSGRRDAVPAAADDSARQASQQVEMRRTAA